MPIQKIFKGSDQMLELNLADENGNALRVKDTIEFAISLYTDRKWGAYAIVGNYSNGVFHNIIEQDDKDYLLVDRNKLDYIDVGLFYYDYRLKVENSNYPSGYYTESKGGQTNLFLKKPFEAEECIRFQSNNTISSNCGHHHCCNN